MPEKEHLPTAAELSLSLELDTASRTLNTGYNPVLVQGQISALKADAQANQPNHTAIRDKRQCIRRLQHIHPSPQHCLSHEYQASAEARLAPKLCVRYVHLQLVV